MLNNFRFWHNRPFSGPRATLTSAPSGKTAKAGATVIIGTGIDFLENRRFRDALVHGEWRPWDGVFSASEILYCQACHRPALRYAACFAAKQAALKALGISEGDMTLFREMEIRAAGDKHKLVLHNRLKWEAAQLGVHNIKLAITQNTHHTTALVILEA
jgi:holo-[acyl-carrier protein] synthase